MKVRFIIADDENIMTGVPGMRGPEGGDDQGRCFPFILCKILAKKLEMIIQKCTDKPSIRSLFNDSFETIEPRSSYHV